MYEIKEINYQQQHINKIDELNSLVAIAVSRNDYATLQQRLDKQQQSLDEIKRVQNERETRMTELVESLKNKGVESEVVKRV